MVTAWTGSAKSRLGLQERVSMPLLSYFVTVGGVLTTLLLLVNLMLEPSKPESSTHAATGLETSLRKPRATTSLTTTGYTQGTVMQGTVGIAPTALGAEAQHESLEVTGSSTQPAHQPSSRDGAERKSFARTKLKSGRKATAGRRPYRDAVYSSYALAPPNWRSSTEGTLGPH
jgi:hypothetical protein